MARRPGSPVRVRMGIRERREERGEKEGGSVVVGRDRGRKPLGRETVKGDSFANSLSEVGTVARIGKVGGAAWEPIVFFYKTIPFFLKIRLAKTKKIVFGAGYVKDGGRKRDGGGIFWVYVPLAGTLPANTERGVQEAGSVPAFRA